MSLNELWFCPDTEPPGLCPWLSTALVVGLFEEEEEGIGKASDGMRGKRRDFSPGASAHHSQSGRVHTNFLKFVAPLFFPFFLVCKIGREMTRCRVRIWPPQVLGRATSGGD